MHLKLFVDVANVVVDRIGADEELLADLFIQKPLAQKLQNFIFSLRELNNFASPVVDLVK
jgi:hypothetical protein